MSKKVRVRFAPSPTGPLNVGGLRTALYDYLFAKKHNGSFVLRLEDTDRSREIKGTEQYILDALEWAGISPDEGPGIGGEYGPYRQSERQNIYFEYIEKLIAKDKAYYAFDTSEELQTKRAEVEAQGGNFKYNFAIREQMHTSIGMSEDLLRKKLESNEPYTVRLKIDPGSTISFDDTVRDRVTFSTDEMDDKIIMKEDKMPTYHLANIVDDHLMEISHVIRGEEWLSSTPHHVFMYEALGWELPIFSHLPLILKPVGKGKLSKRDSAKFGFPVFPLDWSNEEGEHVFDGFKEAGYLPEAIINFIAFLGWNPGTDQEVFTLSELVEAFSLEKIGKSGARFDIDKAKWYNQQYLIAMSDQKIAARAKIFFDKSPYEVSEKNLSTICGLFKERIHNLAELPSAAHYLFDMPDDIDEKTIRKRYKTENKTHVENIVSQLLQLDDFRSSTIEQTIKNYIGEHQLNFGQILPIFRIALTGTLKGPDVYEIIEFLHKEMVKDRMKKGLIRFDAILRAKEMNT